MDVIKEFRKLIFYNKFEHELAIGKICFLQKQAENSNWLYPFNTLYPVKSKSYKS